MKHYILSALLLLVVFNASAQFTPYNNTVLFNWAYPYESYEYNNMPFRILWPNNYSQTGSEKYPMVLFFHGAGERGTDNENQLKHGGRNTLNAVQSGEFPGVALYPQITSSDNVRWTPTLLENVRDLVLELIDNYNVDPYRIYIHGLSAGGDGTWRFADAYPQLVAAMHPMSNVPSFNDPATGAQRIPIWLAQGGRDRSPTPNQGNSRVIKMRDEYGSNIRYTYYENLGHAVWNSQYNRNDFFTWFLDKHKTDITVFYGQHEFCAGDPINIQLGLTTGFDDYQWVKDDTTSTNYISTGSQAHTITVTSTGKYYARFYYRGQWSRWSDPVDVNRNLEKALQPTVDIGNQSTNLPTLSGQQDVTITGPTNQYAYQWFKDALAISGATTNTYTAFDEGSYGLAIRPEPESAFEADGIVPTEYRAAPQPCFSDESSPIIITTENSYGTPVKPSNFTANLIDQNTVKLEWFDKASDELAFELYRSKDSDANYQLIQRISANTNPVPALMNYIDTDIRSGSVYYYRLRAVNNFGGSDYTVQRSVNTAVDTEAPSAPVLSLVATTDNSITINWTPSSDNDGIKQYQIYRNGQLISTTENLNFENNGLLAGQVYSYTVVAMDFSDNLSAHSNQVSAVAEDSKGLNYRYYHTGWISSVNQITSQSLVESGSINNFDISIRQRGDRFAFIFEGFISIPSDGNYNFYTNSDDGSKLYINGQQVVNNDGLHGCSQKGGSIYLTAGFHQIYVNMFERGGGECLQVRWQGPGIAKDYIPDDRLYKSIPSTVDVPNAPSSLTAVSNSNAEINLSWTDNSNDENEFEIFRSQNSTSGFEVIAKVNANVNSYSDTGLEGSTTYYYKIKAINFNGISDDSNTASATTQNNPAAPLAPAALLLTNTLSGSVNLSWTDNSINETGFELYRALENNESAFTLIHTTAADVMLYEDTQVSGNTTYYYKIRALGSGNNSAYTAVSSITTPNTDPVIQPLLNRSVQYNTTLLLDMEVNDEDGDPITINFDSVLPSFITFDDNGYGEGQFTISPQVADAGTYTISFTVNDGYGGSASSSFQITVSDNANPIISSISNFTLTEGFSEELSVNVTDDEAATGISLSAANLPAFVTFTDIGNGAGYFSIDPVVGEAGSYSNVKLIATDAEGGLTEERFNILVKGAKRNYSVFVNFGPGAVPSPWNNGIGKGINALNSNDGEQDIALDVLDKWFNSLETTVSDFADYPVEVVTSGGFKRSGNADIELRDLNPGLSYDISFLSSHTGIGAEGANYSDLNVVIGGESQTIDPNGNTDLMVFTNKKPNGSGRMYININADRSILNAMVIDVFYDDGLLPAAPNNLSLSANSNTEILVEWNDNSNNEQRFEIFRSITNQESDFVRIGNASLNQTSFTDSNLSGNTTYFYKVRAVNATGFTETSVSSVSTLNSAPEIEDIQDIALNANDTLIVSIPASDAEGDPISFNTSNLPVFATLLASDNDTAHIQLTPRPTDVGYYGNVTITASDIYNEESNSILSIIVNDDTYDSKYMINLGNNYQGSGPWYHIMSEPTLNLSFDQIADLQNTSADLTLEVGSGWTAAVNDNLSGDAEGFLYSDYVFGTAWYSDQTSASLTLSGFEPNAQYSFELIASTDSIQFAEAIYTVGNASRVFDAAKNSDRSILFSGIMADANGEINISLNPVNSRTNNIYLNAIIIEKVGAKKLYQPLSLRNTDYTESSISLEWIDRSIDEAAYEVYYTDEVGKPFSLLSTIAANAESYTHSGLQKDEAYIYKVRAVDAQGESSTFSEEVYASTLNNRIYVNINTGIAEYSQALAPWNNTAEIPTTGLVVSDFIDYNSITTTVGMRIDDVGDGSNNRNGPQTGNDSGVYPDAVLQAYYYFEPNALPGNFSLFGLDENMAYDLTFLGSHGGAYAVTDFSVDGTTKTLFGQNNIYKTITFKDISPDANNEIPFIVDASNENQAQYGFFNALVIDVHKNARVLLDRNAPTKPSNLTAANITNSGFDLSWNPSSDDVQFKNYEVYVDGTLYATTAVNTIAISGLEPGIEYVLSVRASDRNSNRSAFSEELVVATLPPASVDHYYYQGGALQSLSSWNSEPNGSGAQAVSFDTDHQYFHLTANASLTQNLTITGSGSKLIVEDAITLDLDAQLSANLKANSNAIINVNHSSSPKFTELDNSSLVVFSGDNTIPSASYGRVTLNGNNSTKNLQPGNLAFNGELIINDQLSIASTEVSSSTIILKGDVTFNNDISLGQPEERFINLVLSGSSPQRISSSSTSLNLNSISVSSTAEVLVEGPSDTLTLIAGSSAGGGISVETGGVLNLGHHKLNINGRGTINASGEAGLIAINGGEIKVNSTSNMPSNLFFDENANTASVVDISLPYSGIINLRNSLTVTNHVKMRDGVLASDTTLILHSGPSGSAYVAAIENTGRITGDVIVQKYMAPPTQRMYKYLGSSVLGSTIENWQQFIPITGNFEGASNGGNLGSSPSVYYYDENTLYDWVAFPTTTNQEKLECGRGYAVYLRNTSTPTTLSIIGELNQGDFNFTLTGGTGDPGANAGEGDGWNLIANPYASNIVWDDTNWNRNGIGNTVSIWDADYPGGGKFLYYDGTVSDPEFTGEISAGQGFWVQTTDANPSLTITENAKVNSASNASYRNHEEVSYLTIELVQEDLVDRTFIKFSPEGDAYYNATNDGRKRPNGIFNISSMSKDDVSLAINNRSVNYCADSIPLHFEGLSAGSYTLGISNLNTFKKGEEVYLIDHQQDNIQKLSMDQEFSLTLTEDDLTNLNSRYTILVKQAEIEEEAAIDITEKVICAGSALPSVTIENSQNAVEYTLWVNQVPTEYTLIGDGNPLHFELDNALNLKEENIISFTATINGCYEIELSNSVQFTVISKPSISPTMSSFNFCSAENKVVNIGVPDSLSLIYRWYTAQDSVNAFAETSSASINLDTLSTSTMLYVEVENSNGCLSEERYEIEVIVNEPIQLEITQVDDFLVVNYDGLVNWFLNDSIIAGENEAQLQILSEGRYRVEAVKNDCYTVSAEFEYVIANNRDILDDEIKMFPNPVSDYLHIVLPMKMKELEFKVFDVQGRQIFADVKESSIDNNTGIIDVRDLKDGIYILRIFTDKTYIERKIIKN